MKKMAASLLALALLGPAVTSALAPHRAQETLKAIKKKLPKVVRDWIDKKTSSLLGMVGCQSMALSSPRILDRPPEYFPPPPFPWPRELATQEIAGVTPDPAKEKLEAMKAKLPRIIKKWGKDCAAEPAFSKHQAELRLVRQTGPAKAKITILLLPEDTGFLPDSLTIYLRFHDGKWTSTRFDCRRKDTEMSQGGAAVRLLMLAIDELGEK